MEKKSLQFGSNFSPQLLILNGLFEIKKENEVDKTIRFKTPTISDILEEPDYMLVLALLSAKEEVYEKLNLEFSTKTRALFLYGITAYEKNPYYEVMNKFWSKYIKDFKVENFCAYSGETMITNDELEYISDVVLISASYKQISDLKKTSSEIEKEEEGLTPLEKKMLKKQREAAEKLRKAKERKQEKEKNEDSGITIEKIIVTVSYEFNLSIEEIKKLNYYTLYWYFSHAMKIDYHKVIQMAAGMGNLGKKNKYAHWAL